MHSILAMTEEVRYHMLRPAELVRRRKEFPTAYVPVGTLEWHGVSLGEGLWWNGGKGESP